MHDRNDNRTRNWCSKQIKTDNCFSRRTINSNRGRETCRWIKEAVHIQKEGPRSMNRDEGSYQLSHTYDRFLGLTLTYRAKNRKKKTQYQLLLMKASDRGRNVKRKELFGCFDEIFISMQHTCSVHPAWAMILQPAHLLRTPSLWQQ